MQFQLNYSLAIKIIQYLTISEQMLLLIALVCSTSMSSGTTKFILLFFCGILRTIQDVNICSKTLLFLLLFVQSKFRISFFSIIVNRFYYYFPRSLSTLSLKSNEKFKVRTMKNIRRILTILYIIRNERSI